MTTNPHNNRVRIFYFAALLDCNFFDMAIRLEVKSGPHVGTEGFASAAIVQRGTDGTNDGLPVILYGSSDDMVSLFLVGSETVLKEFQPICRM